MTDATETTTIKIDGVEYDAPLGARLLDYLLEIGKEIPHFCYHPGLPVDASCRQCQVESKGKGPRPGCVVSCREKIVPEMEIETESPAAQSARRGVMEFLLVNHPLDCPICDKAGECTLQDNAYATGQGAGRSHEERRAPAQAQVTRRQDPARQRALHPLPPLHPLLHARDR